MVSIGIAEALVSLVLLILFMVMTPILVNSQLKADLPKASSAASRPPPDKKPRP